MEQNSQVREGLISQIEDEYGRIVYTFTCHLKQARILSRIGSIMSWLDICLTAITTGSLLGLLFSDEKKLAIVSAICAGFALMINLYQKEAKSSEKAAEHISFAQKLWLPRERYLSLLTDAPLLSDHDIRNTRDGLLEVVNDIYQSEPATSSIAYRMAKKALKDEDEQFFSRDELNHLLPSNLRR